MEQARHGRGARPAEDVVAQAGVDLHRRPGHGLVLERVLGQRLLAEGDPAPVDLAQVQLVGPRDVPVGGVAGPGGLARGRVQQDVERIAVGVREAQDGPGAPVARLVGGTRHLDALAAQVPVERAVQPALGVEHLLAPEVLDLSAGIDRPGVGAVQHVDALHHLQVERGALAAVLPQLHRQRALEPGHLDGAVQRHVAHGIQLGPAADPRDVLLDQGSGLGGHGGAGRRGRTSHQRDGGREGQGRHAAQRDGAGHREPLGAGDGVRGTGATGSVRRSRRSGSTLRQARRAVDGRRALGA